MVKKIFIVLLLPLGVYSQTVLIKGKNTNGAEYSWFWIGPDSALRVHVVNQATGTTDTATWININNMPTIQKILDSVKTTLYGTALTKVTNDSLKASIYGIVRTWDDSSRQRVVQNAQVYLKNDSIKTSIYGTVRTWDDSSKQRVFQNAKVNISNDSIKVTGYGSFLSRISNDSIRTSIYGIVKTSTDIVEDSAQLSRKEVFARQSGAWTVTTSAQASDSTKYRTIQNARVYAGQYGTWTVTTIAQAADSTKYRTIQNAKIQFDTLARTTFTVRGITNALPSGTNTIGKVGILAASSDSLRTYLDTNKNARKEILAKQSGVWSINTTADSSAGSRKIQYALINAQQYGIWSVSSSSDSTKERIIQNATINALVDSAKQRVIQNAQIYLKNDSLKISGYGSFLSRVLNDSLKVTLYGVIRTWDDSSKQRIIQNAKLLVANDSLKTTIYGIVKTAIDSASQGWNNKMVARNFGYEIPDSLVDAEITSTIEMDSLTTDLDWQRIWYPDSTKTYNITFISISTGDSTIGYEILLHKMTTTTSTKTLFKNTRLTGNAQVVMNFIGAPINVPVNYAIYARRILPNAAIYGKYNEGALAGSVYGSGLRIMIKYRKW